MYPQENKSRFLLKNWRPISLLTVLYKLESLYIAERIKQVLPVIISNDQKCFIGERFIGENLRLIYDIMFQANIQKIPGMILLIDFEKAFDSISWSFLRKAMVYFNCGQSLIRWVSTLYNKAESWVIQNSHLGESFMLGRGCRQGDPLSPYLFLISAEVMGIMIRSNTNIKGISIENTEYILSQYADDTQLFLDSSEKTLNEVLILFDNYYKMSSLKMNVDKAKAVWIGSQAGSSVNLYRSVNFEWVEFFFSFGCSV